MADGHGFIFTSNDSDFFAAGTLTLEEAASPLTMPGVFVTSVNPLPVGVRSGQTLIVDAGAAVGTNYSAAPGSTLEVQPGGAVGSNFEALGAVVNIKGGSVGDCFTAAYNSVVHISDSTIGNDFDVVGGLVIISGGTIGSGQVTNPSQGLEIFAESTVSFSDVTVAIPIKAFGDSTVTITGETVVNKFVAESGSVIHIAGGSIGQNFDAKGTSVVNIIDGSMGSGFDAESGSLVNVSGGINEINFQAHAGSTVNYSGGTFEPNFIAGSGSTVNIFGTQFTLGGDDITNTLTEDESFAVANRGVELSGVLADGTPFDFQLNTRLDINNPDQFSATAMLTITLVFGIPGDFNDDGEVNAADYYVWKKHYGKSAGGLGAGFEEKFPVNVPEPGVRVMVLAGLAYAAGWWRRGRGK
jgi:hypothetical protein